MWNCYIIIYFLFYEHCMCPYREVKLLYIEVVECLLYAYIVLINWGLLEEEIGR